MFATTANRAIFLMDFLFANAFANNGDASTDDAPGVSRSLFSLRNEVLRDETLANWETVLLSLSMKLLQGFSMIITSELSLFGIILLDAIDLLSRSSQASALPNLALGFLFEEIKPWARLAQKGMVPSPLQTFAPSFDEIERCLTNGFPPLGGALAAFKFGLGKLDACALLFWPLAACLALDESHFALGGPM